jgi:glycosyltransferase involved in cell wall biosynthesis
MADHYDIWVITRANNRPAIDAALSGTPHGSLHFVYYDLPGWARWWKRGRRGVQLYYYLWQIGIYFVARRLHKDIQFDLAHHVTFGKYWSPSLISLLPIPFIWGPVGGGESAPRVFWTSLGARGMLLEILRESARCLFEIDPLVRLTAKRSRIALAKTRETGTRLIRLGAGRIEILGESAISQEDLNRFSKESSQEAKSIKIISIGRLLPWKGFSLGLRAFAMAVQEHEQLKDAEYWLVGDGPEFHRLQGLSNRLGIACRVKFWGNLSRDETINKLQKCNVLVHPSLHDSGGWVCLEAMAAGKPVICLELGGPATQVTDKTGFKVFPGSPAQVIHDIATNMAQLAKDPILLKEKEQSARNLIASKFLWDQRKDSLSTLYKDIIEAEKALTF